MPDGTLVEGLIESISAVATQAVDPLTGQETTTIDATVGLIGDPGTSGFERAPVKIIIVTERLEGLISVPVSALLALAEGGHAVEVVDGPGTRLVKVELGTFAEGFVEVAGEVTEGDLVVVPR